MTSWTPPQPVDPMDDRDDSTTRWSEGGEGPHGDGPRRCTAKAKATGLRCERAPIKGGTVCYVHGGKARQVKEAAARRLEAERLERELRATLAAEPTPGVGNPLDQLEHLAAEALAMKDRLADVIDAMPTWRYTAHGAGTEQLRQEVALYERAMDRSARFLDLLVKSGFEERRTALAERQGQLVASALRVILERMLAGVVATDGLSVDAQAAIRGRWGELVPVVVPQELRRLTSGEVGS
ncbi:hypothetical protein [Janibacter indicus]|uniref:hypothetical protein n=1 Tax=Janibacter indicus TaxID=857417 RepID=UPI003D9A0DDD